MALETPCDFARARYLDIGRFRRLWAILVFVLGVSVALFLCVSILLFLRSSWLPGAIGMLGTLVNGAAMSWITSQKATAADEEQKAFDELVKTCGPHARQDVMGFMPDVHNPKAAVMQSEWFRKLQAAKQSGKAAMLYLASLRGE